MQDTRDSAGLGGALCLLVGSFAPIVALPDGIALSYFNSGRTDGLLMMAIGILAVGLTLTRTFRALPFAGLAAMAVAISTLYGLGQGTDGMVPEAAAGMVGLRWGWVLLGMGVLLLTFVARFGPRPVKAAAERDESTTQSSSQAQAA